MQRRLASRAIKEKQWELSEKEDPEDLVSLRNPVEYWVLRRRSVELRHVTHLWHRNRWPIFIALFALFFQPPLGCNRRLLNCLSKASPPLLLGRPPLINVMTLRAALFLHNPLPTVDWSGHGHLIPAGPILVLSWNYLKYNLMVAKVVGYKTVSVVVNGVWYKIC